MDKDMTVAAASSRQAKMNLAAEAARMVEYDKPMPRDQSLVEVVFDENVQMMDILHSNIARLREKLTPVLSSNSVKRFDDENAQSQLGSSPLVGKLHNHKDQIRAAIDTIIYLTDNLEV